MEENMIQARKDAVSYEADWQKELGDFKKFIASLTTSQLQQQAIIGSGNYQNISISIAVTFGVIIPVATN